MGFVLLVDDNYMNQYDVAILLHDDYVRNRPSSSESSGMTNKDWKGCDPSLYPECL
jgi:hypothetical protein